MWNSWELGNSRKLRDRCVRRKMVIRSQKPEASCQEGLDHSRRGYPRRPKSTTVTEEGGKDRETPWLLLSFHFSISHQCSHE